MEKQYSLILNKDRVMLLKVLVKNEIVYDISKNFIKMRNLKILLEDVNFLLRKEKNELLP